MRLEGKSLGHLEENLLSTSKKNTRDNQEFMICVGVSKWQPKTPGVLSYEARDWQL